MDERLDGHLAPDRRLLGRRRMFHMVLAMKRERILELAESDALWHRDRDENGWTLEPVAWPWRLPVIRWLRFAIFSYRIHRHANMWASVGIGIGGPNQYDRWRLYAIYRGWA